MKLLHIMLASLLSAAPALGIAQQPQSPAATASGQATSGSGTQGNQVQPQALATVNSSSYVIGPEDALQVTVWKEPTLSGTFPVRPDGMISMVLIGDVAAAGLTPLQLANNVGERLKKFVQDPSVSVVVTGVNSQRIFVIGEVNHVGPLQLTAGMTPLQAISAAGGLTTFASSKHIYILRGDQGKQQKISFNYKLALKGDNSQLIALRPGDTIVVP
jgi:polysaccharide biosynthesis/export protein